MLENAINAGSLFSVYQPIVDTYRGAIIGNESLIRGPEGSALALPAAIFSEADKLGARRDLECYCVRSAVNSYQKSEFAGLLFININPNFLCSENVFLELTALQKNSSTAIVLELSEQHPVENILQLKKATNRLRNLGFRFAIDDLGAGHSSMMLWAEIRPEFIKIDRYFISEIHKNPYKREFVQHIVTLAKNLHATVIAEGIETIQELRQLQKIGIFAMQGFLIGRPALEPLNNELLEALLAEENHLDRYNSLHALVEDTTVVTSSRRISDILDYFQQNNRLVAIPVVDNEQITGIIRRGQFMELMSSNFGRALYANKPVSLVMQTNGLIIDINAPLEQASALLTEHENTLDQHVLLIQKNGKYCGVIAVPSLLRRITEFRIQNARYANPLTLLPGNVPINQQIDLHITNQQAFFVLYFDLNNFKPYNDIYGYHQGDTVIQWFAQMLHETFTEQNYFVGHVGGDDFIVICDKNFNKQLLDVLKAKFLEEIQGFYRQEHLETNTILARARNGRFQNFPILDYSVGIVEVIPNSIFSHQEVSSLAADLKRKAKANLKGVAQCRTTGAGTPAIRRAIN